MKFSLVILTLSIIFSCNNNEVAEISKDTLIKEEPIARDTIISVNDSLIAPDELIKNGKSEDFILECDKELKQEVINDINYYREQWKSVPNPFIAKYIGNDFGDYFHLSFKDKKGKDYDFGFGNNNLKDIPLYFDNEQLDDNPKYINKTFKVYWNWKVSTYPCCSGGYETVKVYHPSITKLKIISD